MSTTTTTTTTASAVSRVLGKTDLAKRKHYIRRSRRTRGISNATEGYEVTQAGATVKVAYCARMWEPADYMHPRFTAAHETIAAALTAAGYTVAVDGPCRFTVTKAGAQ